MSDYNLYSVISSFEKWKKTIIITTIVAAIGSVIISLTLPNYFKATATFYAASEDLSKPDKVLKDDDINYYGNDEDVERIITIANSNKIVDFMITQFDLFDHYEIDKDMNLAQYKVRKAFSRNYEITKAKYGALEISFVDKDPDFAAMMANAILSRIVELSQGLVYESQRQLINLHQNSISEKEGKLQWMNDSLKALRADYKIYDIIAQNVAFSEMITQVKADLAKEEATLNSLQKDDRVPSDTLIYKQAAVNGLRKQLSSLNADLKLFNDGRDQISILERQIQDTREALSMERIKYNLLNTSKKTDLKTIHVVEPAEPPLRKFKPKRSILVLGATFFTFIFMFIGALLFDQYRVLKSKT